MSKPKWRCDPAQAAVQQFRMTLSSARAAAPKSLPPAHPATALSKRIGRVVPTAELTCWLKKPRRILIHKEKEIFP